jgi:uncharacterized protein (UPF0332 family)
MDTVVKRQVIGIRLNKAHEDLATACDNLASGHLRAAVNRAYYTIFHTASAALLWLEVERARHSGIEAAFIEFLVKPGLVEPEHRQIYANARDWREDQEHKDIMRSLDKSTAAQIVADAERFVERMERYLREVGAL